MASIKETKATIKALPGMTGMRTEDGEWRVTVNLYRLSDRYPDKDVHWCEEKQEAMAYYTSDADDAIKTARDMSIRWMGEGIALGMSEREREGHVQDALRAGASVPLKDGRWLALGVAPDGDRCVEIRDAGGSVVERSANFTTERAAARAAIQLHGERIDFEKQERLWKVMPRQQAMAAADEAFQRELERVYGKNAGDARYQQRHDDPGVERARSAYQKASEEWNVAASAARNQETQQFIADMKGTKMSAEKEDGMEPNNKSLAGELNKIAMGEMYSDSVLRQSVERLEALRDQPEHANPEITKDRINQALVHCKLALHGVRDTHHRLQDASWLIAVADGLGVERGQSVPADEDPRWKAQMEDLINVTASINAAMAPESIKAEFDPATLREYAEDVGMEFSGKVEQFDDGSMGASFTRDAQDGMKYHVALMVPAGGAQVTAHAALCKDEQVLAESAPMLRQSALGALDAAVESLDDLKVGPTAQATTQAEARMSNTYNVSVTYEVITDESAECGDVAERGYEREREDFDEDGLQRLVQDYGFSQPSSTHLDDRMWFSTESPREDRAYFEDGERRFFSLHLHSVNGEEPTLEDYADIARMARISMPDLDKVGTRIQPEDDEPWSGPDLR